MKAGTFETQPLPQTTAPGPNWAVSQDVRPKSFGAQNVSSPNDPGGIGDASGQSMIARLQKDAYPVEVRPTKERLVNEGTARIAAQAIDMESEGGH